MDARSAAVAACSVLWLACGGSGSSPEAGATVSAGAGTAGASPLGEPPVSIAGPGATDVPTTIGEPPASSEAPGVLPLAGGDDGESRGSTSGPSATSSVDAGASSGAGAPAQPGAAPAGELSPLTIWIAGDSTVANGQTPCPRGWGGVFAPHFNDRATVVNLAAGGRSVNTWLYQVQTVMGDDGECLLERDASGAPLLQQRWQDMLTGMKAGDYLLVQFGINDGDRTCDRHVGIPAFEASLEMMARAALDRGAHPILLTPVSMIACNGNTARGSRGEYVPATLRVGEALGVPVIDLHERSVALYQQLGFCPVPGGDVSAETTGPVGDFFCDDHTHFSNAGATTMADLVSAALVEQQIPLAAYLR